MPQNATIGHLQSCSCFTSNLISLARTCTCMDVCVCVCMCVHVCMHASTGGTCTCLKDNTSRSGGVGLCERDDQIRKGEGKMSGTDANLRQRQCIKRLAMFIVHVHTHTCCMLHYTIY